MKSKIWLCQAVHVTDKPSILRTWHYTLSFPKHSRKQTKELFSTVVHPEILLKAVPMCAYVLARLQKKREKKSPKFLLAILYLERIMKALCF